jgi:hypothetical protein
LLRTFEENVSLEQFYLDRGDHGSLVQILREQEAILSELLRQMEGTPPENFLWNRLRRVAEARQKNEQRVKEALGEISKDLGHLRQSARRLQDWQKAWHPSRKAGNQLMGTYA